MIYINYHYRLNKKNKKTTTYIMIDYFKKNSFAIMSFSLAIGLLLEWMTKSEWLNPEFSKWLIILIGMIGILAAIGMITSALKK